jgi:alkylresorcinol/alkylpyrone synthase
MMHEAALSRHPQLKSIGRALPSNYNRQEILSSALWNARSGKVRDRSQFERIHRSVSVRGRHLALPMEEYRALDSFGKANDKWVERAADLGEQAVVDALNHAELSPHDIDHIFFTTVAGITSPSIGAKLVNRLSMRAAIKRTPIFGLGCVGGAAGIAHAADYLRGFPEHAAMLVSVELCSLTLQREGNLLSYSPGRGRTRRLLSVHASARAGPPPRRNHRRPGLGSFKIRNAWRRLDSELSEQVIELGRRGTLDHF